MRARYLVGADGMHSTVREQAGIGFAARASATSYSLADVRLSGGLPAGEVAVYFSRGAAGQRAFPRRDHGPAATHRTQRRPRHAQPVPQPPLARRLSLLDYR